MSFPAKRRLCGALEIAGRPAVDGDRPEGLGPTDVWVIGGAQAPTAAAFAAAWQSFVYPGGATLAVQSPAVALIVSGPGAHPANRPIGDVQLWIFSSRSLNEGVRMQYVTAATFHSCRFIRGRHGLAK